MSLAPLTQPGLFLRDGYTCQYCGTHVADLPFGVFLTRDHILPLADGGPDVWGNVVACCSTCNQRKKRLPCSPAVPPQAPTEAELRRFRRERFGGNDLP